MTIESVIVMGTHLRNVLLLILTVVNYEILCYNHHQFNVLIIIL